MLKSNIKGGYKWLHILKIGFIRPDGTLLLGDHHNALARDEFKIKNFCMDPTISPALNLINLGYLLVSSYSIILPTVTTKQQCTELINMLSVFEIQNIPVIDSKSTSSITSIINSIPTLTNNPTLKFLKSYLLDIKDKINDAER